MSSKASSDPYVSKGKCQWCGRQTDHIEKFNLCQDQICDRCVIKNVKTKSKCPICWEKQISSYLIFNQTCSGNITPMIIDQCF